MYFFIHKNATIFRFFFTCSFESAIYLTYLIKLQTILETHYSGYSTLKW